MAAALLALAGCGSSSSNTSSSASAPASAPPTSSSSSASTSTPAPASGEKAAQALSLAANPEGQLKYDKSALTAKAGRVTISFTNSSPLAHNVVVASSARTVAGATETFQGGTKTLSLTLKAGTYKYYCTVPGHRAAGMEGTLTVH